MSFDAHGEARARFCLDPKVRRPLEAVRTFTSIDDAEWTFEIETSLADLGVGVPHADGRSLLARITRRLAATLDPHPAHGWNDPRRGMELASRASLRPPSA